DSRLFKPATLLFTMLSIGACGAPDDQGVIGAAVSQAQGNSDASPAVQSSEATPVSQDNSPGSGVEQQNFDLAVAPGDDFYRHVNGSWLAATPIPADKSNYGAFTMLDDTARENLRTLIEAAAGSDAPAGSDSQKVGDFYSSFMDEARIA